ncbi:hypothetical protein Pfo_023848 [Paulownia fortunei]|nr:hypothetical protein Pfo_023848 [Paulownia fortunei]
MSTDECSSNESGWTRYIASSDHEDDHDDDDDSDEVRSVYEKEGDKQYAEDVDSDDSMASDAASGPSDQYGHVKRHHGLGHAGNKNERKHAGKKQQQQEEKKQHDEQIKAAKDKSGHKADSAGRSKKR